MAAEPELSLCALCGEIDPGRECDARHALCQSCVSAAGRATRKLLGVADVPTPCPVGDCVAMVADQPSVVTRRTARLVRLAEDSREYAEVLCEFNKTMREADVRHIYRVDNPALRAIYETCRDLMQRKRGVTNEGRYFHSTTRVASGAIVREGFDAHRAGESHGTALGPGIYVARDASFTDRYTTVDSVGTRVTIVCSALLGVFKKDSTPDAPRDPAQCAVFREQQVLPTHVIYYAR